MFAWLAKLITAPIIGGVIDGYKAKLAAGNDRDRIAADLAGRELQVQQKEIEVAGQLRVAQVGRWYEPEHLFGYTLWLYFAKCIVWDKVLGSLTGGSTDPLNGAIDTWAGLIIVTYFGKRGIENAVRIWKNK